jgi:hypothetical protein
MEGRTIVIEPRFAEGRYERICAFGSSVWGRGTAGGSTSENGRYVAMPRPTDEAIATG